LIERTALILLEFQRFANQLDTKWSRAVPHQNSVFHGLLKHLPWGVFDRLVDQFNGNWDERVTSSRSHLIAMLMAQVTGLKSLREIETNMTSHGGQLYHLGAEPVSRAALGTVNAKRSPEIFNGLLTALMGQLQAGYRRKIGDCVRLIDSTSVRLNSFTQKWASFSEGVCGAKAHVVYDPDTDQPLYLMVTPSRVNDITAAKQMPIEAGATYVFDLGYYDFGWWSKLDAAGCRIVTRLKANTSFDVIEEREVAPNAAVLSDRIGYLPKRMAASRKNPMSGPVREVRVATDNGKILRIFTNDLEAPAEEIAGLYKRRWAIELFFRWVKQTLKIKHFVGTSENAVRIQIAVALIAFLLMRLAHEANRIVKSPLAFAQLIKANLMHRRDIADLLRPPPRTTTQQYELDFDQRLVRGRSCRRRGGELVRIAGAGAC
jgi:hypothetical protein